MSKLILSDKNRENLAQYIGKSTRLLHFLYDQLKTGELHKDFFLEQYKLLLDEIDNIEWEVV